MNGLAANPFWMVYRDGGQGSTAKHSSLDAARREAKRLARSNPDQRFYVLAAVQWAEAVTVQTGPVDVVDQEMPF